MAESLDVSVIWHYFTGAANFTVLASAITLENRLGKFDILPGHANFISTIYGSIVVSTMNKGTEVYFFQRGVVEVSANSVKLFLEGKID